VQRVTIGAAVTAALEANKHEVIRASRKLAPRIDISDHFSNAAIDLRNPACGSWRLILCTGTLGPCSLQRPPQFRDQPQNIGEQRREFLIFCRAQKVRFGQNGGFEACCTDGSSWRDPRLQPKTAFFRFPPVH
jgi:hypothetical protein